MPSDTVPRHAPGLAPQPWIAAFVAAGIVIAAVLDPNVSAQYLGERGDRTTRRFYPDDPIRVDPDRVNVPEMVEFEVGKSFDFLQNTFSDAGGPDGVALNINSLSEVPDSSWFTNRIGAHDMTVEDLVRGPDTVDGPAAGAWTVTGRPEAGLTPKFTIKDARGDTYMIKLDPAKFPELSSSVEEISTKLFHAIGYWVPEDFVVVFDPARLQIADGATARTETGKQRRITPEDVEHWLRDQPRRPGGSIRALASRFLKGKPVGPFRFYGTRPDDPNDLFPHERRRELRGMRVFAAWLNHDDARSINTFDSYIEEAGRHYIRHNLLDFGSNLGSGSTSAQQPRGGNEYLIDGGSLLKGLVSLGFWQQGWTRVKYPDYPAVGNLEADVFEPAKWKTEYPQPAFARMDAADAFWAASIVSRFTDGHIRAAVRTGAISDPAAESYLADTIMQRRDKVVTYWISRTNPLDRIRAERTGPGGGWQLAFDNAAVRLGGASPASSYRVRWAGLDNLAGTEHEVAGQAALTGTRADVPAAWGPADDVGDRYLVARIVTEHPGYPQWTQPVQVSLRLRGERVQVVGITRPR